MPKNTSRIGKIRTPPKPAHWDADGGVCRLCGCDLLKKDGTRARNRRWCAQHGTGWRIASQPIVARAAVFLRDAGVCKDCGEDCTSYEAFIPISLAHIPSEQNSKGTYRVQINRERAVQWCMRILEKSLNPRQTFYLIDLGQWEVDHIMPLHLVDREDPKAYENWLLGNLVTRCPSCHTAKSNSEAKARAKVRRLTGANKPKLKAKIPQRKNPWPPKGSRKFQNSK
jgi:5-methylcytosine-specific restriction endonuclease McrA